MPGVVSSRSGARGSVRLDAGVEVEVPVNGLAQGERCHAVVRPEKLRIVPADGPTDGPAVDGIVESSVFLGTATQIVVRLAGDVPITVLVPNADEAERQRLPGRRREREAFLGAGAHPSGAHLPRRGRRGAGTPTEAEMA